MKITVILAMVAFLFGGCADIIGPPIPGEGGELDFDLQVTVWSGGSNAPVPGATVYAAAQGWTTYAVTNANGMVLLAVPERAREVTVYAQYGVIQSGTYRWYLQRGLNEFDIWM